jgi:AraC-like DNA-binding protein
MLLAEEILKLLPVDLRGKFKVEVDGSSLILHYNDVFAAPNTRAAQLRRAELALQEAGYAALEVRWDIYVSEWKPKPGQDGWPPRYDVEKLAQKLGMSVSEIKGLRYSDIWVSAYRGATS